MLKKLTVIAVVLIMILTTAYAFEADTYAGYMIPVDIDVNGSFIKCVQKPFLVNNSTYIPLRAFADAIGGEISWDESENAATLLNDGHTFVFYAEQSYCMIDGEKYDYCAIEYKDLLFIPVRIASEKLGYTVEWDDLTLTVKITAPQVEVIQGFVDKSYTYEDIIYLAKITWIESGYQPFEVKLGVANTVVNRMRSDSLPSTIKEVILDTRHGIQFPPAHTERINETPSKECVIAAKCALNGENNVGTSMYFVNVKYAATSWVHNNRPHYTTIGNVAFYE